MLNHPHLVARHFIGKCSSKTLMTAHHYQLVVTVRRPLEYHYHCSFLLLGMSTPPVPNGILSLKEQLIVCVPASGRMMVGKCNFSLGMVPFSEAILNYLVVSKILVKLDHFPKVRGENKKHLKPGFHSQTSFWNRGFAKQNLDQEVGKHGYTRNPLPEIECMMTVMTIPPKDHHKGIPWFIQGGVDQAFCSYNLSISNQNDDRTTHPWTNSSEIP